MSFRLHGGGRFRTWLGSAFGGDFALGDRLWRRILHAGLALVLIYYWIPEDFFLVPKQYVLLAALGAALTLEMLRHGAGLDIPMIRDYERGEVGSFALFALAVVLAIFLFPMPVACAVILGTAVADPVAGELRLSREPESVVVLLPFFVYASCAWVGMAVLGGWPLLPSGALALFGAALAIALEGPRVSWLDDDLGMTMVPGLAVYLVGVVALGLPL